jgi:hypothetical protein
MGLINDENYCDYVDSYNLINPNNLFNEMNILTDYNPECLAREVIKKMGYDVLPDDVHMGMNKKVYNSVIMNFFLFR